MQAVSYLPRSKKRDDVSIKMLKKNLLQKPKREIIKESNLLSTGSTLLNLACSGNPRGGLLKGKYYLLVGDSASGKTALSLTMLAEASINHEFDNYRLIHDDIEGGNLFKIRNLFGRTLARRIEKPADEPSNTIEDMYYNVDDALEKDKPFIYIVDSMDGLQSKADDIKFEEQKKAHRKQKESAGSFGTVAKINSTNLRRLMTPLAKTKSLLVIISQTRDNLGFGFDPKTRSGGRAMKFYATLEIWSSIKKKITKTVRGKTIPIGIIAKLQVKKNRLTGVDRVVEVPIYYSVGFDDTGSCIDYLIEMKHWSQSGQTIHAKEFKFRGTRDKLIRRIEVRNLYFRLQNIVGGVWSEVEESCRVKRKSRYE